MEADSAGSDKHFVCDYCPKKYLRKNNLEDHILMEHPDTEQATEIIQHKARNGRSKGSLIVQCEICSKRFRYQSYLKNHYESHFRGRARGSRGVSSGRGGVRGGGTATSPRGGNRPQPYRVQNLAVVSSTRGVEKADGGYQPAPPQYNRTRPCLYCGKTFLSRSDLQDHEETEATEFEKEAVHFESENKMKMGQPTFESYSPDDLNHVIDRTDEEFGDAYSFPKNLKIKGKDTNDFRFMNHSAYTNHVNQTPLTNGSSPVCNKVASIDNVMNDRPISLMKAQYNNHTSQYTSLDPVCPLYQGTTTPPPAHEDQTIAHGFFPPPPPLPVPQFTQICHKRSDAEFADPNEDKTYTTLQSNDESSTRSSLLQVDSMSPSREVLDLSLPKTETDEAESKVEPQLETVKKEAEDEVVDYSVKPDSSQPKQEVVEQYVDTTEPLKEEVKAELKEELIIFEPSSMPSMPEAVLSFGETKLALDHEDTNTSDADFKYLSDEYSGLMNPDDDLESFRSQSPLQFDDPNRIDCKFCGMVFTAPHVRKFHEQGHNEEHEEYDGELTRLFCGFCGKVFKKATYRMLHEKGHTGELAICCHHCERRFRWDSELRSHHKMCTAENPAKPQNKRPKFQSTPRHTAKDDWIDNHPSMPTGWKLRTRPRPTQEGQLYFIFLSPEGQVFHSRKAVLQHMEKTGGYSVEDINKVRKSAKTGPRGRGGRGGGASRRDRAFSEMELDLEESNLDSSDLDPPYTPSKKEPETDAVEVEGKKSLRLRKNKVHLMSA